MAIALALGFLALTAVGPAFARERGNADRGAKNQIVGELPSHTTIPISFRSPTVGKAPFASAAILRLVTMLNRGIGF